MVVGTGKVERLLPAAAGDASRWPELQLVGDLLEEVLQSYRVSVAMLLHPCSCMKAGERRFIAALMGPGPLMLRKSGDERPERTAEINRAMDLSIATLMMLTSVLVQAIIYSIAVLGRGVMPCTDKETRKIVEEYKD
ncbi:hypothetical protein AXF42_Ash013768 [Apostasia shenzhenica]|uniref:Uncharacterized protein n=1 Tax=Apostasia shenzhenica TaxID=1088818 RepID=A0A2I0A4V0_9ASPA|nr:hypothetical protein AXF42_Ash013768 [Apostasia shenzhenica]